jgi:hypothetical protein
MSRRLRRLRKAIWEADWVAKWGWSKISIGIVGLGSVVSDSSVHDALSNIGLPPLTFALITVFGVITLLAMKHD